jgi:hypothetical protein
VTEDWGWLFILLQKMLLKSVLRDRDSDRAFVITFQPEFMSCLRANDHVREHFPLTVTVTVTDYLFCHTLHVSACEAQFSCRN